MLPMQARCRKSGLCMWLYVISRQRIRQDGFILIAVLLFLNILMLLSLYTLESNWLIEKSTQAILRKQNRLYAMESILMQIEEDVQNELPNCVLPMASAEDELRVKTFTWWQEHACQYPVKSTMYYYVLEPLGVDRCTSIPGNKEKIADYYRITLLGYYFSLTESLWIQSTIVSPNPLLYACDKEKREVTLGRQSFRIL